MSDGHNPAATESESGGLNQETILSKALIDCLFVLIRTTYIHEQHNQALLPPLKNIAKAVDDVFEHMGEPAFVLRVADKTFFLNEVLVKLDQSAFQNAEFLQIICEDLDIGEFEFHEGCLDEDFRLMSLSVVAAVRGGATELRRQCGRVNLKPAVKAGKTRVLLDRRQYVLRTYAMALTFNNNMLAKWRVGKKPRLSEVKRLSQALLDLIDEDGVTLLGLTQLKAYKNYLANHFVNVAIVSQVIGKTLGMRNTDLVQVGMTGTMHEIGIMDLPEQIIDRIDALGEDESRLVSRLPMLSVRRLFELEGLGAMGLSRIVAVFENAGHVPTPTSYKTEREPDAVASIVAVADAYDHLSTSRMGNAAMRPDQALEVLLLNREKRFADWAVKALAEGIGRYPIGTMVELDTRERGIVIDRPRGDASADRPKIRLVAGPDGVALASGAVVDLAELGPDKTPLRSISLTLDPEEQAVNVPHFFLD